MQKKSQSSTCDWHAEVFFLKVANVAKNDMEKSDMKNIATAKAICDC